MISFDQQSGFTPPRQNKAPVLSILANGTVQMPDLYGQSRDVTGKISQTELQELLRFIIKENNFFSYDMKKVQAKITAAQKARPIPQIADAPVSVFEIRLAKRKHNVRHYALGMASAYKGIDELQQLRAIQQRLNQLMNETRVGGKAGIEKLLKHANRELKKQHPNVKPFATAAFRGSYILRNGKIKVTFSRHGKKADGKPDGTYVVAIAEVPVEGEPQVEIRAKFKSK